MKVYEQLLRLYGLAVSQALFFQPSRDFVFILFLVTFALLTFKVKLC